MSLTGTNFYAQYSDAMMKDDKLKQIPYAYRLQVISDAWLYYVKKGDKQGKAPDNWVDLVAQIPDSFYTDYVMGPAKANMKRRI